MIPRIRSGYCWSCKHCYPVQSTSIQEDGKHQKASCFAPITKEIWKDWRVPIWKQNNRAQPPEIPGGPIINRELKQGDTKWPILFLPDAILGCKHYKLKPELKKLVEEAKQFNESKL